MIHSLEVHIKTKFRTIKSLRFPILLGNAVAAVHKMPRQTQQEQRKQGKLETRSCFTSHLNAVSRGLFVSHLVESCKKFYFLEADGKFLKGFVSVHGLKV